MTTEERVREILEKRDYTSRSCRFLVIEQILGISPEEAKMVETITRTIRQILPADEKGIELEKLWHNTPATREAQSFDNLFKRQGYGL